MDGIEFEFIHAQQQTPIDTLLVTTKAHQLASALQPLLHRLSPSSTLVLLHNGLGVLEEIIERCFPHDHARPSFVLAHTSHGVQKLDSGQPQPSHGHFLHSGTGDLKLGVLPNETVLDGLRQLSGQDHWYPSTSTPNPDHHWPQALHMSSQTNPLLNPSLPITPSLEAHLPHLQHATHTLHHTLAALLRPELVEALGTKWLTLPQFQTSALVKLAVNAALNPLTALLETRNGSLAGEGTFSRMATSVCREASAVFARQTDAPFPLDHPLAEANLLRHVHHVLRATAPNISSMCADMRKLSSGRIPARRKAARRRLKQIAADEPMPEEQQEVQETEIEYINGYISRLGLVHGVPTPVNDVLLDLIRLKTSMILTDERLPPLKRPHRSFESLEKYQHDEQGEFQNPTRNRQDLNLEQKYQSQ